MAASINKVILVGNLGADPEVRQTQDGNKIVSLRVATSESWNDKATGERKERTEWHRVVIFQAGLASVAERILSKGSKVYVEGQLRTRKYQNTAGQDVYTTEVVLGVGSTLVLLSGRGEGGGSHTPSTDAFDTPASSGGGHDEISVDAIDDDIPF